MQIIYFPKRNTRYSLVLDVPYFVEILRMGTKIIASKKGKIIDRNTLSRGYTTI
jgi:hypothetical protein